MTWWGSSRRTLDRMYVCRYHKTKKTLNTAPGISVWHSQITTRFYWKSFQSLLMQLQLGAEGNYVKQNQSLLLFWKARMKERSTLHPYRRESRQKKIHWALQCGDSLRDSQFREIWMNAWRETSNRAGGEKKSWMMHCEEQEEERADEPATNVPPTLSNPKSWRILMILQILLRSWWKNDDKSL